MILGRLIEVLETLPVDMVLSKGFHRPHSYRGYYNELAFEPAENITIGEVLASAKNALGNTYTGYKGGEFTMSRHTDVYLAHWGSCGDALSESLLDAWIEIDNLRSQLAAKEGDE